MGFYFCLSVSYSQFSGLLKEKLHFLQHTKRLFEKLLVLIEVIKPMAANCPSCFRKYYFPCYPVYRPGLFTELLLKNLLYKNIRFIQQTRGIVCESISIHRIQNQHFNHCTVLSLCKNVTQKYIRLQLKQTKKGDKIVSLFFSLVFIQNILQSRVLSLNQKVNKLLQVILSRKSNGRNNSRKLIMKGKEEGKRNNRRGNYKLIPPFFCAIENM